MTINYSKHRKPIQGLYEDKMDLINYEKVRDPVTGINKYEEKTLLSDVPCRISYKTIKQSESNDSTYNSSSQIIKLFIAPEIDIPPGSKVVINRNGAILSFKRSGMPAIYHTHKEIVLEEFKGWN